MTNSWFCIHKQIAKSLFKLGMRFKLVLACTVILFITVSGLSSQTITYDASNPGTGTFTVPNGVRTITVVVWGGGGKGGNVSGGGTAIAGGGGGGAYSRSVLNVTNGQSLSYSFGLGSTANGTPGGDSWFGSTTTVMAKGGVSVANTNNTAAGGAGGLATQGFGTIKYNGGTGATAASNVSGGGGSSAGISADGASGSGRLGGIAPTGGGNGGNAPDATTAIGAPGSAPGGGGGGAWKTGGNVNLQGGNGANGKVVITYTVVVSATNSVVSVNPTQVIANGTDAAVITVTVRDEQNNLITGLQYPGHFTFGSLGTASIGSFSEPTGGTYTFNLTNASAQIVNPEVFVLGLSVGFTGPVTFENELLAPTTQPSNLQFSAVSSSSITVGWTNGNGNGRIVLVKEGATVNGSPVNGTFYTANADFSATPPQIGTGNYVVYAGTGSSFVLEGLSENTIYYIAVFEYNSNVTDIKYLTTSPLTGSQLTKVLFQRTFEGQRGWRMIAFPLQNTTVGDIFDGPGLITQGFTGSNYPSDAPNLLFYLENYPGTDNQRWGQPSNSTNQVVPGLGYLYYVFGNQEADNRYNDPFPISISIEAFETDIVSNAFNFSVTYTPTADSGWNLVGNPFASDINWDNNAAWTKANMSDAIYVWDPSLNGGFGDYLTWSSGDGDAALGGQIAKGQSFWVKASGASPSLVVTTDAKTTGAAFFNKAGANKSIETRAGEDRPSIQLILEKGRYQKSAYITFSEQSSRGLDRADAYYLQPLTDSYISIFTRNTSNDNLTINSLPRRFNVPIEIPIYIGGFESGQSMSGVYEISIGEGTHIPETWAVELIDKTNNNRVMWKSGSDPTFRVMDSVLRASDADSTDRLAKLDSNISYGFMFNYEKPITISTPSPGQPILLKSIEGTASSRFALRINPNGEFSDLPEEFILNQNYPNPFNPLTNIEFGLPLENQVQIDVYDIMGRRVATLANQVYSSGMHSVQFNGSGLASGVYILQMRSGAFYATRKMTLIK